MAFINGDKWKIDGFGGRVVKWLEHMVDRRFDGCIQGIICEGGFISG
jgi:hypothetical protein